MALHVIVGAGPVGTATAAGLPTARLRSAPYPMMWTIGLFSTEIRELRSTRYQFTKPFTIDSTSTEQTFDLAPTDLDIALKNIAR
jgi:hypothetical protein